VTLELRWSDIDWDKGRIPIRESKTKARVIPLFEETRPYLATAFEQAEDGAVYVIQRYRSKNANLRTQLLRILSKASVPSWPRLFHNLRASRETELANEFPIHVVCEWIGNSMDVARRHYLQVTEEHFQKATSNPTSHMHAEGRTEPHAKKETAVSPAFAKDTAVQIPPRGVEQPADSGRETENPPAPGTESGTPAADPLPELLALVVELPPEAAALLLTIARRLRPS
jgi:hypothetical protein